MRARVAHLSPSDRIVNLLLRPGLLRLQEAGFEVTVICGRVAMGEELARTGLRVIYIPFAREIEPRTDWACARALYQVLRRERFDIVHSHNPKGTLLGPVVGQLARVPVVTHTVHGFLFHENTTGLVRGLAMGAEWWCARWCDHLLFQSEEDYGFALAQRFREPERLHLVGNGIDERRFDPEGYPEARRRKRCELGLEEWHLVVGMVARLVREKGYEELFAMAGQLARQFPQLRLLVVGITERDQWDAIDPQVLIAAHGLEGRCLVLEQRQDMPELYACMDVAVLPSHREGIPRAIMEAAAMGVPVVASDIRGCREIILHGESGLLFPLRDVEGLTTAVRRLLLDEGLRRRLGEAGRRRVLAHYTEARTAARVIACYERFLAECG
ncbi:MAG: glycosyltransferase family 4 protein [Candidatus Handelsmanbacteria bacterium]|nr:glycosyltransferase family 4 protein [Candidatus Handelsmanbacteria bacterium]